MILNSLIVEKINSLATEYDIPEQGKQQIKEILVTIQTLLEQNKLIKENSADPEMVFSSCLSLFLTFRNLPFTTESPKNIQVLLNYSALG